MNAGGTAEVEVDDFTITLIVIGSASSTTTHPVSYGAAFVAQEHYRQLTTTLALAHCLDTFRNTQC